MSRDAHERCAGGCCNAPAFPFTLRLLEERDKGFVLRSWLESYHKNSPDVRSSRFAEYRGPMMRRMLRLLARSVTVVAVEPDDGHHLLGFAVVEARAVPAVHFIYVAHTRRESGLGAALFRAAMQGACGEERPAEWCYTHGTYLGRRIANRGGHGGRQNTVAAWNEVAATKESEQ